MVRPAAPKRPTSADVAREAGLSRSTVSYVLNDDPQQKIPPATRERVFAAAAKLGYTPSAAARALRSGRSDLVLCLMPDWPIGAQFGALLEQLSAELEAHDLTLVLHPRVHSNRPVIVLWKSITPAAVLLLDAVDEHEEQAIRSAGAPVVSALVGGKQRTGTYRYSEETCGRLQVEHLAATGHRAVGYAYPDDERVQTFAIPRLEGVRLACADLGLDAPDVQTVPLDPAAAEIAVKAWRSAAVPVTGVCAYNDEVAMAVLAAAHRLGVRVPDQLAVIGVDDIPSAALTVPTLTTVTRDLVAYAQFVTEAVRRAIDSQPALQRWPHSDIFTMVQRESA